MTKTRSFAYVAALVAATTVGCRERGPQCPETLAQICAESECPGSPRDAELDPERFPHVYADGERFVIGYDEGHAGYEYHFQISTLVGYRGYADILGGDCESIVEIGTLHTELRQLETGTCNSDEGACVATCSFNSYFEELPPCDVEIFDTLSGSR